MGEGWEGTERTQVPEASSQWSKDGCRWQWHFAENVENVTHENVEDDE